MVTSHQLLDQLDDHRRAHSLTVAQAAATRRRYVPDQDQDELVTAALLHDIGYAVPGLGFHPIDGARYLRDLGYSPLTCHLVATHTCAHLEAAERGLDPAIFSEFTTDQDTRAHRAVIMWADLTTGPDGTRCTVQQRLAEITTRYVPSSPVHRYITRWGSALAAAADHPEQHHPDTLDHPAWLPGYVGSK